MQTLQLQAMHVAKQHGEMVMGGMAPSLAQACEPLASYGAQLQLVIANRTVISPLAPSRSRPTLHEAAAVA
jgi:hypothetical protein